LVCVTMDDKFDSDGFPFTMTGLE